LLKHDSALPMAPRRSDVKCRLGVTSIIFDAMALGQLILRQRRSLLDILCRARANN
jgi:hypothetical protein